MSEVTNERIEALIKAVANRILDVLEHPKPTSFDIYKGTGALKAFILKPRVNEKGYIEKNGAILIEMARGERVQGQKLPTYHWEEKVSFALNQNDIAHLVDMGYPHLPENKRKIIHDHKGFKTFDMKPGEGQYEGTWMVALAEKLDDGSWNNIRVPMTDGEYTLFLTHVKHAVPLLNGW